MKPVSRMIIAVLFCVCAYGNAEPCKYADEAEVSRLAAAAWKEEPISIDVTLYVREVEAPKAVEEIRRIWADIFSKMEDSNRPPSDSELQRHKRNIEINVERTIKEQQVGRWFKKRIRISGDRRRVDQTYIRPEVILSQGWDPNDFVPQRAVALSDPCDLTTVILPNTQNGGYTHLVYTHTTAQKSVQISNRKGAGDLNIDVIRPSGLPRGVSLVLQSLLGARENVSSGVFYVPDSEKLEKLRNAELDQMSVSVCQDSTSPEKRDRVEIKIPANSPLPGIILTCEREDYSRVYHFEASDPRTGQTLTLRESSEFDTLGFPRKVVTTEHNMDGSVKRKLTYVVSKINFTPSFDDHLFDFKHPQGYAVVDHRISPVEEKTAEVERLKAMLTHELWKDRLEALMALSQVLEDDPAELRGIAQSMLDDEHPAVRERASRILREIGSGE